MYCGIAVLRVCGTASGHAVSTHCGIYRTNLFRLSPRVRPNGGLLNSGVSP